MSYKHFTVSDREKLAIYLELGKERGWICEELKKDKSSLSREIKRNSEGGKYSLLIAEEKARNRRSKANSGFRETDGKMMLEIKARLEQKESPKQLSGRMKKEGKESLSHETIYKMIYQNHEEMGEFTDCLRQRRRKRRKRGLKKQKRVLIPNRKGIEERPKIEGIGHWEGDTVIGKNHKGAIGTFVDKKSKYFIACLLKGKKPDELNEGTKKAFSGIEPEKLKTFTFDNGLEFFRHTELMEALKAESYFANPYHSWERGLNEHTNGLLRQYFPKKTDFSKISEKDLALAVRQINNRPRESLDYQTPFEVFFKISGYPCNLFNFVAFQT
jgi:IS30 family transposase